MNTYHDIEQLEDIKLLVDTFYTNIREDALLGSIFNERIKDRWPEHLDKMYRFWQTILLNEHTYTGSPFAPHANMPIDAEHFDTWKAIFLRTVDELFSGEQARTIKWRAISMAEVFLAKIEYSRQNGLKSVQ